MSLVHSHMLRDYTWLCAWPCRGFRRNATGTRSLKSSTDPPRPYERHPMTETKRRYRHIVIRCHPEPESFNAAMAKAYCAEVESHGHETIVRDLYAMAFDPVLKARERPGMAFQPMPDVETELAIIGGGDVFVLFYPIWFGGPPAILKGYVERVLGSGAMPQQIKQ